LSNRHISKNKESADVIVEKISQSEKRVQTWLKDQTEDIIKQTFQYMNEKFNDDVSTK
jgi:hypothetical protein